MALSHLKQFGATNIFWTWKYLAQNFWSRYMSFYVQQSVNICQIFENRN